MQFRQNVTPSLQILHPTSRQPLLAMVVGPRLASVSPQKSQMMLVWITNGPPTPNVAMPPFSAPDETVCNDHCRSRCGTRYEVARAESPVGVGLRRHKPLKCGRLGGPGRVIRIALRGLADGPSRTRRADDHGRREEAWIEAALTSGRARRRHRYRWTSLGGLGLHRSRHRWLSPQSSGASTDTMPRRLPLGNVLAANPLRGHHVGHTCGESWAFRRS